MKDLTKIYVKGIAFIALITANACSSSFMDVNPMGTLNEKILANAAGVDGALTGAYSLLDKVGGAGSGNGISSSNWVFGGVTSDDAYKGSTLGDLPEILSLETFQLNASIALLDNEWKVLYDAVQRCNDVIRLINKAQDMNEAQKNAKLAEARFLRGHFHFEAKKKWNNIPYLDESISYENKNVNVPNDVDVWPKIEEDFKFASQHLPEVQPQNGRANKWAAKSYLGKTFLFQHKYPEAKTVFTEVISSGVNASGVKYDLISYHRNFNAEYTANAETVFAVKFSVNDGSDGRNGNRGDRLNGPYNWGPAGGSGFYQPSQSLVNSYRVDADGLPFLDTFNDVDVKNDQGLSSSTAFVPDTAPLDPRLDWTVGRRGLPYHDWGLHPGQLAIREQSSGGPYTTKKTVYYKSQEGVFSDATALYGIYTTISYNVIRFADVLLMAAEAEAELNNLVEATRLVNLVRKRAAQKEGWLAKYINDNMPSLGFSNTPAANYRIGLYPDFTDKEYAKKAVRFERKLELAMEGHRFFDLVRYGTAGTELTAFWNKEKAIHTYYGTSKFVNGNNEYLPIPQTQIDLSKGTLKQNNY